MTGNRQFPIMGSKGMPATSIPWKALAPYAQQAQRNHGQTLERLAERGGLCWSEAWGIINGVSWGNLPRGQEDRCRTAVLAYVERVAFANQEPEA